MTICVVATMVVRDEVDIIAANLDHLFFQGVQHVLVTDNGSLDGTRGVLSWYSRHHEVTVFDEPVGAFWQSEWVTRMARLAVDRRGANWVVHVDADEFLIHPRMRYPEIFASIDDVADVVTIPRLDYLAVDGVVGDVAPRTQVVRKFESLNPQGFRLMPKVAHRGDAEATVAAGNHQVEGPSLQRVAEVPELAIHHFPARSLSQVQRKITNLSDGHTASGLIKDRIGTAAVGRRRMLDDGAFDDEYRLVYGRSPEAVEAGLADGSLVIDTLPREVVTSARSDSPIEGEYGFRGRIEAWMTSATTAGAVSHGIDLLLDVDPQRRRLMAVFQMQAKEMLRDVRALIDGPIVVMKGIELAQLYPEPWRRDFVDVDILAGDVEPADARLRGAGFTPFASVTTLADYHQTAPLVRGDNPITIELHRRPNSPRWAHFPSAEIIAQARPSRTGLDGVMRPRDDHHAVLVAWHYWRDGAHRARDLVDLHLLRQRSTGKAIQSTADSWGVGRVWRNTERLLDALEDDAERMSSFCRRIVSLDPVSHRDRRLRQWWGISMGGRNAWREVLERDERRRQRATWAS